jgi:hypothetical protein
MDNGALSPGVKRQGMKLTTHLHLVPRSRKMELYLHSPICLHGIMLKKSGKETTLTLHGMDSESKQHYTRRNQVLRQLQADDL